MFGHVEFEGERRGLYPVWEQPDVAKRAESPFSLGGGATRRPAIPGHKDRRAGGDFGINRGALRWFCVRLSDFEVLHVIQVIHRLF